MQWTALVVLSTLISLLLGAAGLPAALLLGPLIGGIVFGTNGVRLSVPRWLYLAAQAIVGTMVAASANRVMIAGIGHEALPFCFVLVATLLGAATLGWLISRSGLIPGATAVYGMSPGAAGAMVLLSEAEGADVRLVAFMQYSRVLLVVLGAALVARFWAGTGGIHVPGASWLAPVHWLNLGWVLLLAVLSQQIARLLRIQAWGVLGPILLLGPLHLAGWLPIELPRWLMTGGYAFIGWHIGLGFRQEALRHVGRTFPVVVAATLCLIAFCGVLAWCLTRIAHVDALTAYLATSPGGIDSVAIIAASTAQVNLPFVLALQSMRLLSVMALAPMLSRLVVRHSPHLQG